MSRPVDELAEIHRSTSAPSSPARRPRRNSDHELADVLESVWRTRFGEVSVVAAVDIARLRGML